MSAESEVRAASEQFYAALNHITTGDAGPMAHAWSHGAAVTSMHPLGGRETGWDQVGPSWSEVAKVVSAGQVKLTDQHIHAAHDMAYEVGVEKGHLTMGGHKVNIDQRVTNVYRRHDGAWKIVHHHSDLSSAMIDLLAKLQPKT
jgi:ketosteroid isomerase-like protein